MLTLMRTHIPGNVRMLSVSVTAGMCKPCVARFPPYVKSVCSRGYRLNLDQQSSFLPDTLMKHPRTAVSVTRPR